jgi:hypothetical protein
MHATKRYSFLKDLNAMFVAPCNAFVFNYNPSCLGSLRLFLSSGARCKDLTNVLQLNSFCKKVKYGQNWVANNLQSTQPSIIDYLLKLLGNYIEIS